MRVLHLGYLLTEGIDGWIWVVGGVRGGWDGWVVVEGMGMGRRWAKRGVGGGGLLGQKGGGAACYVELYCLN